MANIQVLAKAKVLDCPVDAGFMRYEFYKLTEKTVFINGEPTSKKNVVEALKDKEYPSKDSFLDALDTIPDVVGLTTEDKTIFSDAAKSTEKMMVVYGKPNPDIPQEGLTIDEILVKFKNMFKNPPPTDHIPTKDSILGALPKEVQRFTSPKYKFTKASFKNLEENVDKLSDTDLQAKIKELFPILNPEQKVNPGQVIDSSNPDNNIFDKTNASWDFNVDGVYDQKEYLAHIQEKIPKPDTGTGIEIEKNSKIKEQILLYTEVEKLVTFKLKEIYFLKKSSDAAEYALWLEVDLKKLTIDWPIEVDNVSIKIWRTANPKILTEMNISAMQELLESSKNVKPEEKEEPLSPKNME